ncbi:hypothetical protein K445DRAFT_288158 [Daldinia sp. EC12]|nr:hypothetical protein K445DRAFT_288158 [Daldinia sp. EC12]
MPLVSPKISWVRARSHQAIFQGRGRRPISEYIMILWYQLMHGPSSSRGNLARIWSISKDRVLEPFSTGLSHVQPHPGAGRKHLVGPKRTLVLSIASIIPGPNFSSVNLSMPRNPILRYQTSNSIPPPRAAFLSTSDAIFPLVTTRLSKNLQTP